LRFINCLKKENKQYIKKSIHSFASTDHYAVAKLEAAEGDTYFREWTERNNFTGPYMRPIAIYNIHSQNRE